jgi:hypothetical protein
MIQTAIVKTSAAILIFAGFISFAQHSHSPASFYQELSWPAIMRRRCRLRNEPRVVSRSEPRIDTHFGGGLGGAICRTAVRAPGRLPRRQQLVRLMGHSVPSCRRLSPSDRME